MTVLETVPVDRITARARQARPGHVLVTVIAGLLFGLGWLIAKAFAVLWFAGVWSAMAVAEGWSSARRGQQVKRGPTRAG